MTTDRLLDVDKTLFELGGDQTLLAKIAGIFSRTAPDLLAKIREALDAQDLKRAYGDAHTLKGSVGVFAAPQVFQCVADVAQHAKDRDLAATEHAFGAARPLVNRLLDELQPLIKSSASASGR